MAMTSARRPWRAGWASVLLLPFSLLFFLPGCGREQETGDASVPSGIIRELEADSSITTDVNARAPAFARRDTTGKILRTQDFIGRKVLLLDFWSVFCQSCLEEMPFLQELYSSYHDQGLEILSINTDFFPLARIESFMKSTGLELPFPLIHDRDQGLSKLFQVEALPVTVLIDSSGWIRMVHLGYRPKDHKMITSRVRKACRKIKETVVTLQPVEGRTAYSPPGTGHALLPAGAPAPDFEAVDESGRRGSFADLRSDAPSLVFFWSLFCQPCREEFPHLQSLSKKFSSSGLKVFAVNIDSARLYPAAIRFAGKHGKGLLSLFDDLSGGDAIADAFGVHFTPSIFAVASDGTIRYSVAGEVEPAALDEEVARLIAGQAPPDPPEDLGSGSAEK